MGALGACSLHQVRLPPEARAASLAPRRAGCGTSGTALGVPHECPGIKGLGAAGTARNANPTAATRTTGGTRALRTRGAVQAGLSQAVPSMDGATGTTGTTGTSTMVPSDPCYFHRISMSGTHRNIERNSRRSDEAVLAVRAWTVGGVPGRPDACSGTPRARAGCVQGWICRRSQGPIRARSGGSPRAFNHRALHRGFQR